MPHDDSDLVVLVDDANRVLGSAPRESVHTTETPLHRAFSCHLVLTNPESGDEQVLLTRRALTKRSWPGVWTNAFCGHPRPAEAAIEALLRHAHTELGLDLAGADIAAALPHYRYRAVDSHGIVENEICPVFVARVSQVPPMTINPEEVVDDRWVPVSWVDALVNHDDGALSPWAHEQWRTLRSERLIGGGA